MCGNHDHHQDGHHQDSHHLDHDHGGDRRADEPERVRSIFRPRPATPSQPATRSRRAFIGEVGRGTLAIAVFTPIVAACTSSGGQSATAGTDTDTDAGTDTDQLRWARANLGFVSAYVLARGNRAALVDTGVAQSADAIGESLASLGLNYDDVEHVILTHKHADHAGSIAEVVDRASGATVYAGQADLDEIDADAIVGLAGGEDVFGLEMLATPGHTAGHMAVIDHTTGLLVAGDAIFTEDGGVVEGPERFFDDIPTSRQTIQSLAELSFNTLLVGHGDPIEGQADTAVAALATSLP